MTSNRRTTTTKTLKGHGHTQDSAWQNHAVFSSVSAANLPLAMFMEEKKNNNNLMNMTIEENEKCFFFVLLFFFWNLWLRNLVWIFIRVLHRIIIFLMAVIWKLKYLDFCVYIVCIRKGWSTRHSCMTLQFYSFIGCDTYLLEDFLVLITTSIAVILSNCFTYPQLVLNPRAIQYLAK